MSLHQHLCLKTFACHLTPAVEVPALARRVGLDAVDLSGCHIDYGSDAGVATALRIFGEAGIRILGTGVVKLDADEARTARVLDAARAAGAGTVSISLPIRDHAAVLTRAVALAAARDLRLAVHNHGGKDWLGSSIAVEYVMDLGGERVGACIDTAWAIQAGEDPCTWAERWGSRVFAAHLKDFTFAPDGAWRDVVIGEGALDLPRFLGLLDAAGFDGPLAIEYEGDPKDPVPALTACREAVDRALAGV